MSSDSKRTIDFWSATSIVVANMVGTGVFTSLGYQLFSIQNGFTLLMLWVFGGLIALTGAFCYAELANRMPKDGGEFYFLSELFHPSIGFMAGFVSTTVGFTAPVAGAALALGAYIEGILGFSGDGSLWGKWMGAFVIIGITFIHIKSVKWGLFFQRISTLAKVIIILTFVVFGFIFRDSSQILTCGNEVVSFLPSIESWNEIWSGTWFMPAFSIGLVWVSFAYSGWNATAYIAGSVKDPHKNLTRSIVLGTLVVMVLYLLLNYVFMFSTDWGNLVGKKEVGLVAAQALFGNAIGSLMGGIISILLVSTISSMIFTGPRVLKSMFERMNVGRILAVENNQGSPQNAIIFQGAMSLIMLFTMDFESLIYYVAFTLSLFTLLTVFGMIKMRFTHGKPSTYRAFGYPFTPIIFIVMTGTVAWFFMNDKTTESLMGLGTALFGLLMWKFSKSSTSKSKIN